MQRKIPVAVLKRAVNIEDRAALFEDLSVPVKGQHSASGRDHGRAEAAYLTGDLMFIVPEQRLPAFCEDLRDRHLVMFDQHLIRIVKRETELFGEKFPDSGLSAACEAA